MFGDKRKLAALTARYAGLARSWGAGTEAEQDAAARELVRIAKTAAPLDGGADLSDRARHLAGRISRHTTAVRARRVLAEGPRDTGGTRHPRNTPPAPGDNVVLKFAPRRVTRIQIDDDEPGDEKEA